jgi:hypothetical protein
MAEKWKVTAQRQTSVLANGQFEQAFVVTFQTASGVVSSVTVPLSQYNDANVARLIDEQVANIDSVHGLTASSAPAQSGGSA